MHALWGLTMSLGAFKVPSAAECGRASAEAVAYSRRQARFSTRRPTACRRSPIRSYCDVINARREAQPYFFIYPSRGCVSSQQSILRSLRNVIRNSGPGTLFGRGNRALLVFGDVPNAAVRRQTAACVSGHGSQTGAGSHLGQGTAVPTGQRASGGKVAKFPTGAEGKRLQISRGVISVSPCLTANALAEDRSAVSPPCRRKLVRCVKQRRSCVTFAWPPEEAGLFLVRQAWRGPP